MPDRSRPSLAWISGAMAGIGCSGTEQAEMIMSRPVAMAAANAALALG